MDYEQDDLVIKKAFRARTIYHDLSFFLSFFITLPDAFDIAVSRSTQDACHKEHSIWLSSPRVIRCSVIRASDQFTDGNWFDSCTGLRYYSL